MCSSNLLTLIGAKGCHESVSLYGTPNPFLFYLSQHQPGPSDPASYTFPGALINQASGFLEIMVIDRGTDPIL